jgi:hypothetical protein
MYSGSKHNKSCLYFDVFCHKDVKRQQSAHFKNSYDDSRFSIPHWLQVFCPYHWHQVFCPPITELIFPVPFYSLTPRFPVLFQNTDYRSHVPYQPSLYQLLTSVFLFPTNHWLQISCPFPQYIPLQLVKFLETGQIKLTFFFNLKYKY